MHHIPSVVEAKQLHSAPDGPAQRKQYSSAYKSKALEEGEVGKIVDVLAEFPLQVLLHRLRVNILRLFCFEYGLIDFLCLEVFLKPDANDLLFPERILNTQGEIVLFPTVRIDKHFVCTLYLEIGLLRVFGNIRMVQFGLDDVLFLYFLEVCALSHLQGLVVIFEVSARVLEGFNDMFEHS